MAWSWASALILNGALGLAGFWAARDGLKQPRGWPRLLGAFTLAWCWLTIGLEWLGALGRLDLPSLSAWVALGFAGSLGLRLANRAKDGPSSVVPPDERWDWTATAALGLLLLTCGVLGGRSWSQPVKVVSDGPIYHLYFAARWWKEGRLSLIPTPFGENAAPYFPAVGDLWFTWLMVLFRGDQVAKVGQAPFLIAAGAAAFATARRLGAGRAAAGVATNAFLTCTPFLVFTFEPNVDTIFVAGYLMAAYFFLSCATGEPDRGALILGALAAGAAWGTKTTGTVFVPPLLALTAAGVAFGRGPWKTKAANLGLLAALPFATAGFWFARNARLAGNPLYPLRVGLPFGGELPGWYGPEAMRTSPYYLAREDWGSMLDVTLTVLDPRLAPLWIASIVAALVLGFRTGSNRRGLGIVAAMVAMNFALYWFLIPYRSQQRFMFPALGLAVTPLATLLHRRRWLRVAVVVLLALHLFTPQTWPIAANEAQIPWDCNPRIPNAFPGLLSAMKWDDLQFTAPKTAPPNPFPPFRDYFVGWNELDQLAGPEGARVAYAGTNLPYYLMGKGLRNEVRYVNVDAHADWRLHEYHAQARREGNGDWPDSRPGWDRLRPDYDAWLANLRRERIRFLVVARANPAEGRHNVADALGFPIERRWAEARPEIFEPKYGARDGDPQFRIYELRPDGTNSTETGARRH